MILNLLNKRGAMVSEEVITWIIYLAIGVAAGFAIRRIVLG